MKKIYLLLLFLFFHSYFCLSQSPTGDDANRVEVIKMGYMTKELKLTPEEAEDFWPVYNKYVNEIKQARNRYPDDEVAFEKKVVEIKEHYQGNFKKVLGNNNQRANKVYTTDKQFSNTLRNELKNRQQKRAQSFQQPPEQKQQVQKPQQGQKNNGNNSNKNKNNSSKKGNAGNKKPRPPL